MSGSGGLKILTLEYIAIQPGKKYIILQSDVGIRAGVPRGLFEWNLIRLQDVLHTLEGGSSKH